MRCSCPDWGVPCKHLAAVCYVLAEEFDRDPFGLLAWRGRGREDLLAALRQLQGAARAARPRADPPSRVPVSGGAAAGDQRGGPASSGRPGRWPSAWRRSGRPG